MTSATILFFLLCALLILTLAALFIYGCMQRKWRIVITAVLIVLCICCLLSLFPTQFPYADGWIMGKTREQITAVYGEPTGYDHGSMISYRLGKDCGFFGIMSSNNTIHYYIYFNQDGSACRIVSGCQLGG